VADTERAEELEQLEARLERSMTKAAKALAWAGMNEECLSRLVMDRLTTDAKMCVEETEKGQQARWP